MSEYKLLNKINSPKDLRALPSEQLPALADEIRVQINAATKAGRPMPCAVALVVHARVQRAVPKSKSTIVFGAQDPIIKIFFKSVLTCKTGIYKIASFSLPLCKTSIIEHFQAFINYKRHNIML